MPAQLDMDQLLAKFENHSSELLPVLHAIQDHCEYIPAEYIPLVAQKLSLSPAEVYGVIQFYDHFYDTPPAKHTIHICRAEACQANGSLALIQHAEQSLQCSESKRSPDGQYEVHAAYCLGLCANGPAMQIQQTQYAQVDIQKFDTIVRQLLSK